MYSAKLTRIPGSRLKIKPELKHLRTIVAVDDYRGVTRAADKLMTSQPAVTKRIRQLEDWLAAPLVRQVGRGVEFTELGKKLVIESRAILGVSDAGLRRVEAAARALGECVTLGFVPPMPAELTSQILRDAKQLLDCELKLQHIRWDQQISAVVESEVDLSMAYGPIDGFPQHDKVQYVELYTEPRIAGFAKDHPCANCERLHIKDLANEPVVCFPINTAFWSVNPRPDGSEALVGPAVSSLEEMLEVIAAGKATALPAASLKNYIPRDDVVWRPIVGVPDAVISLVWLTSPTGSPTERLRQELIRRGQFVRQGHVHAR